MSETQKYLTIGALTAYLKRKFDVDPYLQKVYVTGEISNMGRRRGRHLYFSIKDPSGEAVISAAMFSYVSRIKFEPKEGMKINAVGRVQLYEPNGSYSIILEQMAPDGVGALFLAYEQLKQKLYNEGLFDLPKKSLPQFPKKIAVVTSPTGAVIEDITRTVQRRFPSSQVVLFPAVVQGDKAAQTIIQQITRIDNSNEYDTLIVGRGGGSIEDLWAFNDEALARTVVNARIPIISSVGHETDTTLIDFVADHRAATPTAAAELATPVTLAQVVARLNELQVRLKVIMQQRLDIQKQRLNRVASHVIFQQPDRLYTGYIQRVDQLNRDIEQNMQKYITSAKHEVEVIVQRHQQIGMQLLQRPHERLQLTATKLDSLSPLKILSRGYTVVEKEQHVVRDISTISKSDEVSLRFSDGVAQAKILETRAFENE